ncbi:MAG TPA: ParB/RepB/Spo0J family partition protein [Anaerolineae bacterium]|nr:ParB/RepB/Spo0J family partition protein [Anaerolineae bacterium]HIQ08356.1 ParB/RepB/Spo0J family partition protein [Anaerolineaceae bacterium]
MTPKRRPGLGKGLDALIPGGDASASGGGVQYVPIHAIRPNPRQPRSHLDEEKLEELAQSIREHGVLQPLIVTQGESPGQYLLIAGERRWRAAQRAGLQRVPVIVREATDQQRLELALIENLQRDDLDPLETAEAYRQLHEEFGLSHEAIAQQVGKSRVAVSNALRLLKLPAEVKRALQRGHISEGHARALLGLPSAEAQVAALQEVLSRGLTVRQTEDLVRRQTGQGAPSRGRPKRAAAQPAELRDLENRLQSHLGTKVRVRGNAAQGTIVIHYYSAEELEAILAHLLPE